ncbi:MAG: FAD-dependent oxidoreductase [Bacteroidota bacterium]
MMENIAIIGTGIAGMGCAHFLKDRFNLDIYEQNNYVGGHTNTVDVKEGDRTVAVDTGFIVFNYKTYPNLVELFRELNVDVKPTNMSFSVQDRNTGLIYSSQSLFAQPLNVFRPSYVKLLFEINRFYKEGREVLENEKYASQSMWDYVKEKKYSDNFLYQYLVPMSSALWSTPIDITMQYPVRVLVQFFSNHGMLGIKDPFQWYTVAGGSREYREKLIAPFRDRIRINARVKKVIRENDKAKVVLSDGSERIYDKMILASHADQSYRMIKDNATELEHELLSVFDYQNNKATLHSDAGVMPKIRKAWSAWNYCVQRVNKKLTACTTYDMNILQSVSDKENYFVSINDPGTINPGKIHRIIDYEHPVFTPKTAHAQQHLHKLNQDGPLYYCGSYFRFGFHEDALTSAVNLCKTLKTGKTHEVVLV